MSGILLGLNGSVRLGRWFFDVKKKGSGRLRKMDSLLGGRGNKGILDRAWHPRQGLYRGDTGGNRIVFEGNRNYTAGGPLRWKDRKDSNIYPIFAGFYRAPSWKVNIPIRPTGMMVAGGKLYVAGPSAGPDPKGNALWVLATEDGTVLQRHELESSPVDDGLAAAGGRLYVSLENGRLTCFAKR